MRNEIQDKKDNFFTQLLEKLQYESWQLELIISSIALYLIYDARNFLDSFSVYAVMFDHFEFNPFDFASEIFFGCWIIFITNLMIHILFRGFWIGAIGLRYVSGEVDYKALNYSEVFEKHLETKVGRFDLYIEKLDKFCSILYAYTFLLFFYFVSIMSYFGVAVLIVQGIESASDNLQAEEQGMLIGLFGFSYLLLGLIYAIDVIFMGAFKRVKDKTVSKIYFYIYRFFNFITLSFFYRSLVYNFIDNPYSRRFIWASIPYFMIVFLLIPNIKIINSAHFPLQDACLDCTNDRFVIWRQYDDLRSDYLQKNHVDADKSIISYMSLGKYEVSDPYQSIFFRMLAKDDEYLERIKGIQSKFKTGFLLDIQDSYFQDSTADNIESFFNKEKSSLLRKRLDSKDEQVREKFTYMVDSVQEAKWDSLTEYEMQMDALRLKSFLSIFEVYIDEVTYTDSLQCQWFIHPNKGEKGVICYFPVQNLQYGWHTVRVKRKMYELKKDKPLMHHKDTFWVKNMEVPFFKLK